MNMLWACLITVAVETAFFALVGYRDVWFLALCACANAATNLTLNLLLGAISNTAFWVYPLEVCVVAVEYVIYALYEGRGRKLLLLTCAANVLTYLAGVFIFGHV